MDNKKNNNIPIWGKSKMDFAEVSLEMKFKQKIDKEIEDKRNIFINLINVIDDIDRIISNRGNATENDNYLDTIRKKILKLLEKYGVTQMYFNNNKAKYGWCEVVDTEKAEGIEEEVIVHEIKKGYLWNDKVLRLASVIIVKNKG